MRHSSKRNNRRRLSHAILAAVCLVLSLAPARAQVAPAGRVNDGAGVLDAGVKERLENMLANLKERGGIEFAVVIVKSREGKKIFDYLQQVSRELKVGSIQGKDSSLLLVVSTEDGEFLAQASRGFRGSMPEGLLGDMGNRMREPIGAGNYNEALTAAVQTIITQMAQARGFSAEGMEQAPAVAVAATGPATPVATDALPQPTAESTTPAQKESVTAVAPETGEQAPKEDGEKETAAKESSTKESSAKEASAKEPAPKAATGRQRSVKEVFTKEPAAKNSASAAATRDTPEKAELDALLQLPPAERVERLKAFVDSRPRSPLKPLATELLIRARSALGDEKLKAGDAAGGVEQFDLAISEIPEKMSDALFANVVSQIPLNLFMRGQRSTSFDAARLIEAKVKEDPKRLLALAGFFLGVENADEAARLSEAAIVLAPDMAAAHHSLGSARHIALRLDEAAAEYSRALELDPKLTAARRSLADLRRASGKAEEALGLYRELLAAEPADKTARAGVVLSLLDLGKKEEAEREMEAALKEDNLALLVGASYWYAAKGEAARAQALANRALAIEPRYTWTHVALARSLVAQKQPLEAERVLRFARSYGRFPTMDYELASALAASGLYEEAGAELARSFSIKDGQVETKLAGRIPARNSSFTELLAPERRAGIFQAAAADTEANARMLKGLLALTMLLDEAEKKGGIIDASLLASAQQDFLAGEDNMRAFRHLYMAGRLLQRGAELQKVIELAEAAAAGVDAALNAPAPTVALTAEDLRDSRAGVVASGRVLAVQEIRRDVLANILRGRIEDMIGWALQNQDKYGEAASHLRRAVSVLPEASSWWRAAQWHLGASLQAAGNQQEALAAYLKSYDPNAPNQVRRAVIETLYRKLNGSLEGLDAKIGPAPASSSGTAQKPENEKQP